MREKEDTITALRAALDQERATTLDLAMLVRKMERELRSVDYARADLLRMQALDYLQRKGLQGSVLRTEGDALLSGRGEADPVADREAAIDRQWQKQIDIRRGGNDE